MKVALEQLLMQIDRRLAVIEARVGGTPLSNQNVALLSARLPHFWGDLEVRQAVLARHREMTLRQTVEEIRAQFGADRTPSISAINRVWQRLDKAKRRKA